MSFALFPKPKPAYYDYNTTQGKRREDYLVLGIDVENGQRVQTGIADPPIAWLLCLRPDGRTAWMRSSSLTFHVTESGPDYPDWTM